MAEQEEERIMIIPLRAAWAASRTDRTPRAIKAIREHVQQHLKPDRIFIDDVLNEYLRKRGREHPPRRIRVAVYPLPHRLSAVGNNVLCNDYGAVVHPGYDDEAVTFIGEVLGVNVVRGTVAGIKTVGSVAVATNKGVLCHPHARPGEMEVVKSTLQVPVVITTANYGAAQVGACMVANSDGAVVGSRTTPSELGRIDEGLGLF